MNLISYAVSVGSIVIIGEKIPWKEINLLHFAYYLLQIELAGICFGISAFLRKGSIGVGLGIAVMMYFMYNEMLKNIEEFQNEVKNQQKELRISEMNTLISQINPHFLYNTLDTIYMLARINGEEKTMKMIQALSKYLRLSLSKGREIVTVEDELENVKSYMEIQQIRNENLFRYEIECAEELKTRWILKLILQPIVENVVKYGFCDIFEGGLIRISVTEQAGQLTFSVYNNGTPMEEQMAEKLNGLSEIPVSKMKDSFEDKKHGYGVINIITRLRLKYGEDVRFFYESDTNGTVCVIQIPDDGKENSEQ